MPKKMSQYPTTRTCETCDCGREEKEGGCPDPYNQICIECRRLANWKPKKQKLGHPM